MRGRKLIDAYFFSQFLYPPQGDNDQTSLTNGDEMSNRMKNDGKYELFSQVDNCVIDTIKELILSGKIMKCFLTCIYIYIL